MRVNWCKGAALPSSALDGPAVLFLHAPGEMDRRSPTVTWLIGIIAAVAVVWLLRAAALVAMPLAAAFFVSIVVYPVLVWLQDHLKRHQWAAVPLTLGLIILVLGGGIWAIAEAVDEAVERAPAHAGSLQQSWDRFLGAAKQSGLPVPENLGSSREMQQRLASLAAAAARTAWQVVSGLVLVLFLVLLMLLEAPAWRRNVRTFWGRSGGLAETVTGIAEKVRQYLFVRTVLGLASALAAGAWLLLLDVDLVLVWVVLTFLLNYIPNIGSVIAVMPPSLMAFVQHGPLQGAIVLGGLGVIEQIIGNYIDPRMQGRRLQISPVVVLMALVFWTWMWGPVGALLAVPMTVTLLAAAAHSETLRPLAAVLGGDGEPD